VSAAELDCLLLIPPFWDPVCVPLGPAALNAYVKERGFASDIFDFNTVPDIYRLQRKYFDELMRQFDCWRLLNVDRNGTELLALHQLLYLNARHHCSYQDMCAQILDVTETLGCGICFEEDAFDDIFRMLFARVESVLRMLLASRRPHVLGISLYNSTWPSTCLVAALAKRADPNIRIVVGGPGPFMGISSAPDEVSHFLAANPAIDYYVLGEGEEALLQILEERDLPGGIRGGARLPKADAGRSLARIHDLPSPDYGSLDVNDYLHLSISTARGCPYECSFCAETVFWQGFRSVKRSSLLARFDTVANRYGRTSFYICDSLSNQAIGPLTDACIREGRQYEFDCYLRADTSCGEPHTAKKWRDGGLKRARLGLESASQRILDEMVKKTDVGRMERALSALASAGVRTSTLWIIGYPGETEAEFAETLNFLAENRSSVYQADAWIFQYSPVGLAGSQSFNKQGTRPRFTSELDQAFGVQFRSLSKDLTAGERFDRLGRFVRRMGELGIPNPYSLLQLRAAERRWAELGHR
jgi:hypothetical protein